jgi:hypothetical protein
MKKKYSSRTLKLSKKITTTPKSYSADDMVFDLSQSSEDDSENDDENAKKDDHIINMGKSFGKTPPFI